MKHYRIALLPGDGIGEEVCKEAVKVLDAISQRFSISFEITHGLIGGAAWDKYGVHFPEETKKLIDESDAILFGSVGGPVEAQFEEKWKDVERNAILGIRKYINATINLRPAPIFAELTKFSPLKKEVIGEESFEILVIRELSGGIYFGEHSRPTPDSARDVAEYDRKTVRKVAKAAFQAAQKRKKHLTSIDKANVLETSRLWREEFEAEAKNWPEVTLEHLYVDNAVQVLVKNPRRFDVLACPNLFGDIISDLTSVFPGSLGMLGSASFGERIHLYEPSGGSAPDIAGKGIANPIAQILSAAMMLQYSFNLSEGAKAIEEAVKSAIKEGYRTADIYSGDASETKVSCSEMGEVIAKKVKDFS